MAVQIILKYGNGRPAPDELVMGEVGVDISGKSLWTFDGTENVQLAGGDIDLGQLPDIDIGDGNFITLGELALIVGGNQEDITKLKLDVAANTANVGSNTASIALLNQKVAALELWQRDHEAAVGNLLIGIAALEDRIEVNEGDIDTNKSEIAKLWNEIGLVEGGLSFAGSYNAASGLIESVSAYADSLGVQVTTPLSNALGEERTGLYFINNTLGELKNSGGTDEGKQVYPGDWLVCDGTQYLVLNYQMETISFEQILGQPEENENLKVALDAKISRDNDVIEGGNYSPANPYLDRNK
jgi:hypothetical protein